MFVKVSQGLKALPMSSKAGITLALLLAGIGYLFGFLNIYVTYAPVDQQPGMSIEDIRLTFWGSREKTALEASIDGTMKPYFASEADYNATKEWLHAGASESGFPAILAIFDESCNSCHSAEAQVAGAVLVSYEDTSAFLRQDTGKPVSRLISLTHSHLLGTLTVVFILVLIFSFTAWSERVKLAVIVFSFLAIVFDIGAWWLAKLSPALSVLVILGGVSLALSFLALIVLSLYDMWLRKEAG